MQLSPTDRENLLASSANNFPGFSYNADAAVHDGGADYEMNTENW
jgi:hypothetical protein